MVGSPTAARKEHPDLLRAVWTRQEENILKLKNMIVSFMDHVMHECKDLTNIIRKTVMPT